MPVEADGGSGAVVSFNPDEESLTAEKKRIREAQRAVQQTAVPKPPPPPPNPLAALMAQQQAAYESQQRAMMQAMAEQRAAAAAEAAAREEALRQQQIQENQAKAGELQNLIQQARSQEQFGVADYEGQLGTLGTESDLARGESQRAAETAGAIGRRLAAGRGLALSGVRLGQESRNQAGLMRSLGGIGAREQAQRDALRRAIERLQSDTSSRVGQYETQIQGLGV